MSSPISLALLASYDKQRWSKGLRTIRSRELWINRARLSSSGPYNADKITDIIVGLEKDPDIPLIKSVDFNQQPVEKPFEDILRWVIFDALIGVFSNDIPDIKPTNLFFVSALISGACLRTGLCNSSVQFGMIILGL